MSRICLHRDLKRAIFQGQIVIYFKQLVVLSTRTFFLLSLYFVVLLENQGLPEGDFWGPKKN